MEAATAWDSLEIAKLLISVLTPLAIVILGFIFNQRLHNLERKTQDDRLKKEDREKKEREELVRKYKPHIEFHINCNFYGPENDSYAAEFIITANNKSLIRQEFISIMLRVRGIEHDEPLSLFEEYKQRLKFPHPLFKTDIIPRSKDDQKRWNYIFVEPDVKQDISFISIIDKKYKYIVAQTIFHYDKYTPHSVERMFEVMALQQTT